jgi:quinol monooxygenase YgiN
LVPPHQEAIAVLRSGYDKFEKSYESRTLTLRRDLHYIQSTRATRPRGVDMVKVAILARVVAKPGKEEEVAAFLKSALPLAQAEPATTVWYALRLSKSEFGIFDAFPDEAGRNAHLNGPIAAALMAKASELLAEPPKIEKVELLAVKM